MQNYLYNYPFSVQEKPKEYVYTCVTNFWNDIQRTWWRLPLGTRGSTLSFFLLLPLHLDFLKNWEPFYNFKGRNISRQKYSVWMVETVRLLESFLSSWIPQLNKKGKKELRGPGISHVYLLLLKNSCPTHEIYCCSSSVVFSNVCIFSLYSSLCFVGLSLSAPIAEILSILHNLCGTLSSLWNYPWSI